MLINGTFAGSLECPLYTGLSVYTSGAAGMLLHTNGKFPKWCRKI